MKLLFFVAVTFLSFKGYSQSSEDAARRRNFNIDNGVAIGEFDPVSYFKGKPGKGNTKIDYTYRGITYFFVNEANREEFKKSPDKYEPAYGGWCAYSMAVNGDRVKSDPTTYKIINGKVHLFYNFSGNNTLLKWNKDEKKLKSSADYYWRKKMH